jgi:hypothetical protein
MLEWDLEDVLFGYVDWCEERDEVLCDEMRGEASCSWLGELGKGSGEV